MEDSERATAHSLPRLAQPETGKNKHDLIIQPVLNGYIVRIGCQTVVFETLEKLLKEQRRYFEQPGLVEKEYMSPL